MFKKLIPKSIKARLRSKLDRAHEKRRFELMQDPIVAKYFPHERAADAYVFTKDQVATRTDSQTNLPIPPQDLWLGYGQTNQEYLSWGKDHMDQMRSIVAQSGHPLGQDGGHILEFGCALGRMLRWLEDLAQQVEVWGADISTRHIFWCKHHLSPPFDFLTTTTLPHLPFEDRYFDFIYAGSVFTHIDDLVDAWLLELRRILRPKGKLYITVHDEHTVQLLKTRYQNSALGKEVGSNDTYLAYTAMDYSMFTVDRLRQSQVFFDSNYLRSRLERFYRVCSVTKEAYACQTAILLEKR